VIPEFMPISLDFSWASPLDQQTSWQPSPILRDHRFLSVLKKLTVSDHLRSVEIQTAIVTVDYHFKGCCGVLTVWQNWRNIVQQNRCFVRPVTTVILRFCKEVLNNVFFFWFQFKRLNTSSIRYLYPLSHLFLYTLIKLLKLGHFWI
jgi:hypothetical protein